MLYALRLIWPISQTHTCGMCDLWPAAGPEVWSPEGRGAQAVDSRGDGPPASCKVHGWAEGRCGPMRVSGCAQWLWGPVENRSGVNPQDINHYGLQSIPDQGFSTIRFSYRTVCLSCIFLFSVYNKVLQEMHLSVLCSTVGLWAVIVSTFFPGLLISCNLARWKRSTAPLRIGTRWVVFRLWLIVLLWRGHSIVLHRNRIRTCIKGLSTLFWIGLITESTSIYNSVRRDHFLASAFCHNRLWGKIRNG